MIFFYYQRLTAKSAGKKSTFKSELIIEPEVLLSNSKHLKCVTFVLLVYPKNTNSILMSEGNSMAEIKWYALEAEEAIKKQETDPDTGLSVSEAKHRLEEYGRNEIPKGKKRSAWMRLLMQFHNVLIYVSDSCC
jgi:magnesium-transporting ATPase (P-type)